MELRDELIRLRERTGMNKKQFSEYFGIPYRTFQDYLFRLMEYKVRMEKLAGDNQDNSV